MVNAVGSAACEQSIKLAKYVALTRHFRCRVVRVTEVARSAAVVAAVRVGDVV